MSWIYLLLAGLLEVVWAVALKHTHGFTRLLPSILVGSTIAGSMFFLALAVRTIPIGTAYAIWVSMGIIGAALAGPVLFNQPLRLIQLVFLMLLIVSVVGMKLTSSR
jgi:quaternary ammonium compound-resistance protein SugE